MTTPINLNKVRKQRARKAARKEADENAVSFGRTKAEKAAEAARRSSCERHLDGHKRET